MKIYLIVVLMVFVSSQAIACIGAVDEVKERFNKYDANKDGYVDAEEWKKVMLDSNFEEVIKAMDKDGDKKLSKEEFLAGLVTDCI